MREAQQRADRLIADVLAELLLAPAQQPRHLAQKGMSAGVRGAGVRGGAGEREGAT